MKRLLVLLVMLLLWGSATAETDPEFAEVIDFAAVVVPEYTVEDGCMFDQTAMLLLKDAQGQVFFAGCVRAEEGWTVTLSTPLPEWAGVGLDTFHAWEGDIRVWLDLPEEYRAYEDVDSIYAVVSLHEDGTWRVTVVNTGWEVMVFRSHSIYLDVGYEYFGDIPISLDVTEIDWARLPRSFHQAMDLLDTSRWRLIAEDHTPVYTADGSIGWYGAAGAAVQVLSAADGMAEVRFLGREDTGYMAEIDLIPGSEQVFRYDAWSEEGLLYGVRDIIICADDPAVTWYASAHDESSAAVFPVEHVEYVYLQGWCDEGCCYLTYSDTYAASGYMPVEELPYTIE